MTAADAKRLVGILFAAFPHPQPPASTAVLWVERLQPLDDVQAAEVAIRELIDDTTTTWLPSIGAFLDAYRAELRRSIERRARERALPEPQVDFQAQAAKARELRDRLIRGTDDAA